MKFLVRCRYDCGVRIPDGEFSNRPGVVGDLRTYFLETVHVAHLVIDGRDKDGLRPLYHVEFGGSAPLAMSLRGVERHHGRRGVHEVYQEWYLTPVD
jgi:hypothetical protein